MFEGVTKRRATCLLGSAHEADHTPLATKGRTEQSRTIGFCVFMYWVPMVDAATRAEVPSLIGSHSKPTGR